MTELTEGHRPRVVSYFNALSTRGYADHVERLDAHLGRLQRSSVTSSESPATSTPTTKARVVAQRSGRGCRRLRGSDHGDELEVDEVFPSCSPRVKQRF